MGKTVITWDYRLTLLIAFLLLILPLKWVFSMLLSAGIHELAHIAAVKLSGADILSVSAGVLGAKIECGRLEPMQQILCIGAGPAASLLLYFLLPVYKELAICGLLQGMYNLLPFYPLDGGRILRIVQRDFGIQRKIPCKEPGQRVQ